MSPTIIVAATPLPESGEREQQWKKKAEAEALSRVEIVPYDPQWPYAYAAEHSTLTARLEGHGYRLIETDMRTPQSPRLTLSSGRKSACLTQDIDAQNTVNPRF
jgi:hypothetical protein